MTDTTRCLAMTWYPVRNQVAGAWAVTTADRPDREIHYEPHETVVPPTLDEAVARHVADLHNEWLEDMAPEYRDTRHPFRDDGMGVNHDWPELARCKCGRERWEDVHDESGCDGVTARGDQPPTDEVVHQCPPSGEAQMPCCGGWPLERLGERITSDPTLVNCPGARS